MIRFLIIYSSRHGQTRKIASYLGEQIKGLGYAIAVIDCDDYGMYINVGSFDAIVVGAPIYTAGYPKSIRRWIKQHVDALSAKPSAFFSVGLGLLQTDPRLKEEERQVVREFLEWTTWQPNTWTIFSGAIAYTKYGWLTKRLMARFAKKADLSIDMSNDHEYTNWREVARFAENFIDLATAEIQFSRPFKSAN
jgi:menaquinone-dependent protoporphyrinogen oxidase